MIIRRFANVEMVLFVVLFIFSGERISDLPVNSMGMLNSFHDLVGGS